MGLFDKKKKETPEATGNPAGKKSRSSAARICATGGRGKS